MPSLRHCTALAVLLLVGHAAAQVPAPQPKPGAAKFNVFLRGTLIGQENVTVSRTSAGWSITSSGEQGAPFDLRISRFEIKYTPDWQPTDLRMEGMLKKAPIGLLTSFSMTTAINEVTQNDKTVAKNDQISAGAIVLPNNFFGAYEALAARLSTAETGADLPVYVAPQGEVRLKVRAISSETLAGPGGGLSTRRFDVTFQNPNGPVDASVTVDSSARFVKLEIPAAGLSVVRDDAASVATRAVVARNPTDADVWIPANGFNLAATLTTPPAPGRLRHQAIVLVGGSGPTDRDETVAGIPIFAQLARALSDAGYIVVRYDKRGVGQSGGRTEVATLADYADDALAVVKWTAKRGDVDDRHIVLAGHSEGGAVALLAARDKTIDALVLMATPGSTGADTILAQQKHLLDRTKASDADKAAKIDLQKKIQAAVISGTGWDAIPKELRAQADTPWFKSFLQFDPKEAMRKVRQPILIVQGDMDTQVFPADAERLGDLARARKKAPAADVVHIAGVNHLFVPAETGEVSEYAALSGESVSPKLPDAIVAFLQKIW